MKKYAVIIDSYPSSEEQKDRLLDNLKSLNSQGVDVLLTSHYPCGSNIIEECKYFLFEKTNNYYFLDSHIINENIKEIKNPIYLKYSNIGDEVFYDRLVVTGWSVSITSQFFNAIKFLYNKGYDYAFYLVDDFICPTDFREKIDNIIESSKSKRNYFLKHKPIFNSWFAPFFFGFTIDDILISRIPNIDISDNKLYQRYFPNCSFEDVMLKIWSDDDNYVDEHDVLNFIFGQNKWDLVSSVISSGQSELHNNTSSSIYVSENKENGKYCIMLYNYWNSNVDFNICIKNKLNEVIYQININLHKGQWFKDYIDYLFDSNDFISLHKDVTASDKSCSFSDVVNIDRKYINSYKIIKNFEKI